MNQIQLAVLRIIVANDGRFSWYQIDRTLSQQAWPQVSGRHRAA